MGILAQSVILATNEAMLSGVWLFDFGARAYNFFTANAVWQANCARLLAQAPPGADRLHVLDLGLGPGVSALAIGEQRPEARLIGLDLAPAMLELARDQRAQAGWPPERLSLLRGDALRLPLGDSQVDAVTGHSFLYLLPDHRRALAEAQRVLRPGGYVAFLEPHAGRASWTWLLNQASIRLWVSISMWRGYSRLHGRFSPASLSLALEQAGFIDITTEVTLGGFGIFGRGRKP